MFWSWQLIKIPHVTFFYLINTQLKHHSQKKDKFQQLNKSAVNSWMNFTVTKADARIAVGLCEIVQMNIKL